MGITRYIPGTTVAQQGEEYVSAVLEEIRYWEQVSSDHAMIDTGERCVARVWDGRRVRRVFVWSGYGGGPGDATVVVDAGRVVRLLAKEYEELADWIQRVGVAHHAWQRGMEQASRVQTGAYVEVVKGRKVPLGTRWYVDRMGRSDYGPFCHLSAEPGGFGIYHRYINPENLRVVGNPEGDTVAHWPDTPYGYKANPTMLEIALELAALLTIYNDHPDGWTQHALPLWRALHDAWLDSGLPVPPALARLVK